MQRPVDGSPWWQHVLRRRPGTWRGPGDLRSGHRGPVFWCSRCEASGRTDPFTATALVTHLHWDHIQGLPVLQSDPAAGRGRSTSSARSRRTRLSLEAAVSGRGLHHRMFPVPAGRSPRPRSRIREMAQGDLLPGRFGHGHRLPRSPRRPDERLPDRSRRGVRWPTSAIFQQPVGDGSHRIPDHVVEYCRGVDVLVHDAQYDATTSSPAKSTWGHCTVAYAVQVGLGRRGRPAGALPPRSRLHDDRLDRSGRWPRPTTSPTAGFEVAGRVREGLVLRLARRAAEPGGSARSGR